MDDALSVYCLPLPRGHQDYSVFVLREVNIPCPGASFVLADLQGASLDVLSPKHGGLHPP